MLPFGGGMGGLGGRMPYGPMGGMGPPGLGGAEEDYDTQGGIPDPRMAMMMRAQMGAGMTGAMGGLAGPTAGPRGPMGGSAGPMSAAPRAMGGGPLGHNPLIQAYMAGLTGGLGNEPMGTNPMGGGVMPGVGIGSPMSQGLMGGQMGVDPRLAMMQSGGMGGHRGTDQRSESSGFACRTHASANARPQSHMKVQDFKREQQTLLKGFNTK